MTIYFKDTLLESWVKRFSLPWAIVMGVPALAQFVLFFLSFYLDGKLDQLSSHTVWNALAVPLLTLYILAVQPFLLKRFREAMTILRPRIALNDDDFTALVLRMTPLASRGEWVCFLIGALAGVAVDQPWKNFSFWQFLLFGVLGQALTFGLIGWFIYTALARTQLLTDLHRQPLGLSFFQSQKMDPVLRWSIELAGVFLAMVVLSAVFVPERPGSPTFIIYGGILLVVLFVFFINRVAFSLFSSVYQSQFLFALILIVLVATGGTVGYHVLERWPWMDGLYMTIISMTTVGYGETRPLTEVGRIFTMFLVITSIGIAGYAISTVAGFVVEGDFNRIIRGRRMDKQIARIKDHIVLCGVGRIGREIAQEFYKTLTPFVIIEPNQEVLDMVPFLNEVPFLQADATRDEVLRRAGIDRASGLVATLPDDKLNVFLVLSVRAINPKVRIIARLADDENREKLLRAGADQVVQPDAIGGLRMASMMIRPSVVTFLDQMLRVTGDTLRVEDLTLRDALAGQTISALKIPERTGLLLVALKPMGGEYHFNPTPDTVLQKEDVLIVIGTPQQLARARKL